MLDFINILYGFKSLFLGVASLFNLRFRGLHLLFLYSLFLHLLFSLNFVRLPAMDYCLLVMPQHARLDKSLPAELAIVALDAKVLVLVLLVHLQVVLLGRAVVAIVTPVRFLPSVGVDVLPELVPCPELGAAVLADVPLLVRALDVLVEHGPGAQFNRKFLASVLA